MLIHQNLKVKAVHQNFLCYVLLIILISSHVQYYFQVLQYIKKKKKKDVKLSKIFLW